MRKLCGDDTLAHVVIATTMWSDVETELAEKRQRQLAASDAFFKPALDKGARLLRHANTVESAHSIIRELIGLPPEPLQIQRETVEERKELVETHAGQDLKVVLNQLEEKHKTNLGRMTQEMHELMADTDTRKQLLIDELRDLLKDARGLLAKVEKERDQLLESGRRHEEQFRRMYEAMTARDRELMLLRQQAQDQQARVEQLEQVLANTQRALAILHLQQGGREAERKLDEMVRAENARREKTSEKQPPYAAQARAAHEERTEPVSRAEPQAQKPRLGFFSAVWDYVWGS